MTLNRIVIALGCQASTIDGVSNISGERIIFEAFIELGCLVIEHLSNSYVDTILNQSIYATIFLLIQISMAWYLMSYLKEKRKQDAIRWRSC